MVRTSKRYQGLYGSTSCLYGSTSWVRVRVRVCKACYYHIRLLRFIWPYLDSSTAFVIAPRSFTPNLITVILSILNSLSQLSRLQQIQNYLARTVVKAPKSCHITPILRYLLWLRITERIQASLTYLQSSHNYPTSVPL